MINSQLEIAKTCDSIKELLLQKNAKYGDSALDPVRVFSKASPFEQLKVRIDDKLSRITRGVGLLNDDEDVIQDLIGYLVLLLISQKQQQATAFQESLSQPYSMNDSVVFMESVNNYYGGDPWDGLDLDNPIDFLGIQASRSPD